MEHPDYVVIRFADNLPDNVPAEFDGMWVDVAQLIKDHSFEPERATVMGHPAVLTDRLETREDGAVGQVYEVRPEEPWVVKVLRQAREREA